MIITDLDLFEKFVNKSYNNDYIFRNAVSFMNKVDDLNFALSDIFDNVFIKQNKIYEFDETNLYMYLNIDDIDDDIIKVNTFLPNLNITLTQNDIDNINKLFLNYKKFIENNNNNNNSIKIILDTINNVSTMYFSHLIKIYSDINIFKTLNKEFMSKKYFYIKKLLFSCDDRTKLLFYYDNENKISKKEYLTYRLDKNNTNLALNENSIEYVDKHTELNVKVIKDFLNQDLSGKFVYYYNNNDENIIGLRFNNLIVSESDLEQTNSIIKLNNSNQTVDKSTLIKVEIPEYMNTLYDLVIDFDYFIIKNDLSTNSIKINIATYNEIVEKFLFRIAYYNNSSHIYNIMCKINELCAKNLDIIKSADKNTFNDTMISEYEQLVSNYKSLIKNDFAYRETSTKNYIDSILKSSDDYERLYSK